MMAPNQHLIGDARNATKYPQMPRPCPTIKHYLALCVFWAMVEKQFSPSKYPLPNVNHLPSSCLIFSFPTSVSEIGAPARNLTVPVMALGLGWCLGQALDGEALSHACCTACNICRTPFSCGQLADVLPQAGMKQCVADTPGRPTPLQCSLNGGHCHSNSSVVTEACRVPGGPSTCCEQEEGTAQGVLEN